MPDNDLQSSNEFRQHWTLLVPGLAGIMLCTVHIYSLGVMIGPLEQQFGWARAQISAGPFIISCIALLGAPLIGVGVDRFGPRRIGLLGVILFCAALAFISTASSNILSWWVRWAILGVAGMFIVPTVWTAAINSLFSKHRGKALAIALCGTSLGATFIPGTTHLLVQAWGWRYAYIGLGAGSAAVVMPLAFFLFRGATDRGHRGEARLISGGFAGYSAREGFAAPVFIKLAGAIFLFSTAIGALTSNAVPILISEGFERGAAAWVAGLVGIGSLIGRLGGGVLLDRFDAKKVAAGSVLAPVVTVILLFLFPGEAWPAAIACVILGLSVGTELDACAYLSARHFGMRSFGTLFGTMNGLMLFATGLAPFAANYVYDITRSYDPVLWALIPLCLVTTLLFLALGRYPSFAEPKGGSATGDEALATVA